MEESHHTEPTWFNTTLLKYPLQNRTNVYMNIARAQNQVYDLGYKDDYEVSYLAGKLAYQVGDPQAGETLRNQQMIIY